MFKILAVLLVIRLALASAIGPFAPIDFNLADLLPQFLALAGFAALAAAVVNALKAAGVVKDGQAPTYSILINGAGFLVLLLIRVFSPQTDINAADQTLETVAQILVLVLGLVGQLGVAKVANNSLRGIPVIGYSHAVEKNKALLAAAPPSAERGPSAPK